MDEIEEQLTGGKPGHQITDSLIRALKEVESSGNPRAVNPDSGAAGAFQFMPSTVKMLKKQGIDFNPFDEKESERAARTYLQMLRDKNGGDLNKALAQYGGHITKDPTNYINKIYARIEKNAAAAPKAKAQPGDEIEQALLGKIEREPEPPAPPPLKLNQLSQFGSLGVPEGDLVRKAMKKYFAPKPVETAPAAKADQITTTTVAPQQAAPKTEYKVGSMADLGKSIVSMADVAAGGLTGLVGQGSYAIQRAMGVPAAEAQKSVAEFVEKRTDPFGRALGISEDPAYKAEATRRLTNYIGENVGKGAAWIAEKTGIPIGDVENMIGSLGLLPIPGAAKVGQRVGATTYGAEQALRDQFAAKVPAPKVEPGIGAPAAPAPTVPPVGQPKPKVTYAELQAQLQQKQAAQAAKEAALTEFANAPTQRELQAAKAQQAQASVAPAAGVLAPPGSVGAAAVTDLSKINAALSQASPQLQAALRGVDPRQMSLTALENQLQAERLGLGVDYYTQGQALQDPRLMSNELNERGKFSDLSDRIASQDPKLKKAMDDLHDRAVQNEVGGSTYAHGVEQIKQYKEIDDVRNADINQKYKALKDAAGGSFPIDAPQFVRNAKDLLNENLKAEFLPATIEKQINAFEDGKIMSFQNFESLRTNLADEMRKAERSGDGNAKFALSLVRQALEDLPLVQEAQGLKSIADQARSAARQRFDALKADPAYAAAVDDAHPDTFIKKYVIDAPAANVRLMRDTFGNGSIGALNIESALINHLREKGGLVEKSNVNQATYNKTFKALEEKLNAGAKPETVESLRDLGDVLYKTKARLPGSFVNESNTYVAQLAEQGVSGAAKAGDVFFTAKTGVPIPVVSTAVQKVKGAFQAKKMKQTLEPAAGVRKRD
jgi:hypothetical protein